MRKYNSFYVYMFLGENNNLLYTGRTTNDISVRMNSHFVDHKRSGTISKIKGIVYAPVSDYDEMLQTEAYIAHTFKPHWNDLDKVRKKFPNIDIEKLDWTLFLSKNIENPFRKMEVIYDSPISARLFVE